MPEKVGERLVRIRRFPKTEKTLRMREKEIQHQRKEKKFHEKRECRCPRRRTNFWRTIFAKNKIAENHEFIFLVICFGGEKTETQKIIRNPENKIAEEKKLQNYECFFAQQMRIIGMQRINRKKRPENRKIGEIVGDGSTNNYLHDGFNFEF